MEIEYEQLILHKKYILIERTHLNLYTFYHFDWKILARLLSSIAIVI